jgi:hypothetical protein
VEVLFPKHPEGQAGLKIVLQEIFQGHVTWIRIPENDEEVKVCGLLQSENLASH